MPVVVEIAYTEPVYRPASHSVLPSGLTPPMSGVPGIGQVATMARREVDTVTARRRGGDV